VIFADENLHGVPESGATGTRNKMEAGMILLMDGTKNPINFAAHPRKEEAEDNA
jgi:hypothetical protein